MLQVQVQPVCYVLFECKGCCNRPARQCTHPPLFNLILITLFLFEMLSCTLTLAGPFNYPEVQLCSLVPHPRPQLD